LFGLFDNFFVETLVTLVASGLCHFLQNDSQADVAPMPLQVITLTKKRKEKTNTAYNLLIKVA
jgi:hypothetical protein